jgi:hypothetical protein
MSTIEAAPQAQIAGPGRIAWGRVLQVVTLVLGLWFLALNVESLLHDTGLEPGAGRLGYREVAYRPGWGVVQEVDAVGAGATAGLRVGDRIRLDRPEIVSRASRAGEVTGATVERSGVTRHVDMIALPVRGDATASKQRSAFLALNLASILPAVFGLFIVLRSRGRLVPVLLGASLLGFANGLNEPPMWMTAPLAVWVSVALDYATKAVTGVFTVAFAMLFIPEGERRLSRLQWVALALYAAGCVTAATLASYVEITMSPPGTLEIVFFQTLTVSGVLLVGANLIPALLKSPPASRGRYTLLLLGFTLMMGAGLALYVATSMFDQSDTAGIVLILRILYGLVAPALFAYTILKDRVMDLGFAVNRTLVYGVVSALLLALFGLVEWGVDHVVPIEGREKNVLVDAAVAVIVFLSFHRVRDFVEHGVESLFFRRWQEAETALRQFVKEAAFVEKSAALTRAFMGALERFADGAGTALYLKTADGPYRRADGELTGESETIDPDDAALIALRAEPKPRELDRTDSTLKAVLIAPIVNRNDVTGVVLLGPKSSGLPYRPDEIELIGWATRQIGLDLHALKIEGLEAAAAEQQREVSELKARNQDLRLALGARQET